MRANTGVFIGSGLLSKSGYKDRSPCGHSAHSIKGGVCLQSLSSLLEDKINLSATLANQTASKKVEQ